MSLTLYTFGNMRKAVMDSITSEAAGFPKENLIDFNPDTYWKPTSAVTQVWDIDLQEAKGCDALLLWVNNYTTDHSGASVKFKIEYSTDDSSYTNLTTTLPSDLWAAPTTHPVYIIDLLATYTFRYWRISIIDPSDIIQLSACILCQSFSLSLNHQLPNRDTDRAYSEVVYSPSGRGLATLYNSQISSIIPRIYMIGSTDFAALQDAFRDSFGNAYPLIIYDGTTYRLVRFQGDSFDMNEFADSLYNPSVTFVEQPYIPDGEAY